MNKENQITAIKKFINSEEGSILVNQVSDDIALFYLSIIKYFADNQNIKINIDHNSESVSAEDDLFGTKTIHIFNINNIKKLDAALYAPNKKIIFTDYKNYKRLNSKFNCINGYQFENDITFFIKKELKINNDELLNYCKNNSPLLFSEISKYFINGNQYSADHCLIEDRNHVLKIRKSIFENKKNNFNIRNLYQNIKKEAEYKKLSFLTF